MIIQPQTAALICAGVSAGAVVAMYLVTKSRVRSVRAFYQDQIKALRKESDRRMLNLREEHIEAIQKIAKLQQRIAYLEHHARPENERAREIAFDTAAAWRERTAATERARSQSKVVQLNSRSKSQRSDTDTDTESTVHHGPEAYWIPVDSVNATDAAPETVVSGGGGGFDGGGASGDWNSSSSTSSSDTSVDTSSGSSGSDSFSSD